MDGFLGYNMSIAMTFSRQWKIKDNNGVWLTYKSRVGRSV